MVYSSHETCVYALKNDLGIQTTESINGRNKRNIFCKDAFSQLPF